MRDYYPYSLHHAYGYIAEETRRIEKSLAADAKRVAFGFNAEEAKRIERTREYDTPQRTSIFPLLEWGWSRARCLEYLKEQFGVAWTKSACLYCPFNKLNDEAIERHKAHPSQVADALMLEHVSLSMNPRGTLYPSKSLVQITQVSGNGAAMALFESRLTALEWAIYRVRRLYHAARDKQGVLHPDKKGNAIRAVERMSDSLTRCEAEHALRARILPGNEIAERRCITYVYRLRCGPQYPTKEEFIVAAPAVVATKARYGMEWFEQQWKSPQLSLFE